MGIVIKVQKLKFTRDNKIDRFFKKKKKNNITKKILIFTGQI